MARFRQTALVHGSRARGKLQRAGYKLAGDAKTYSPRLYTVLAPDETRLADPERRCGVLTRLARFVLDADVPEAWRILAPPFWGILIYALAALVTGLVTN